MRGVTTSPTLEPLLAAAFKVLDVKPPESETDVRRAARELAVKMQLVPNRALTNRRTAGDDGQIRKVENWLRAKNNPAYDETLSLLVAAGVLEPLWSARLEAELNPESGDPMERHLATLLAMVEGLVDTQLTLGHELEEARAELASLRVARASRPGAKGRRRGTA